MICQGYFKHCKVTTCKKNINMLKSNGFLEPFLCLVDFKPTANNVNTMLSTTRLSSVVCLVGGGELGQCDGVRPVGTCG